MADLAAFLNSCFLVEKRAEDFLQAVKKHTVWKILNNSHVSKKKKKKRIQTRPRPYTAVEIDFSHQSSDPRTYLPLPHNSQDQDMDFYYGPPEICVCVGRRSERGPKLWNRHVTWYSWQLLPAATWLFYSLPTTN
jgi:hypothetical protein